MLLESRSGEHVMWVLERFGQQAMIWEKDEVSHFGASLELCPVRILQIACFLVVLYVRIEMNTNIIYLQLFTV